MTLIGSPEWFYNKSKTTEMDELISDIEDRRVAFINRFSPEKLTAMSGMELLQDVFGDNPDSMMRWLMFDKDYRRFGASGQYKYLGIVYQEDAFTWKYKEGAKSKLLNPEEAADKAEIIRDQLISCVMEIENAGILETIQDYLDLQNRIEKIFFYKYPWTLKYYQMLYPQYFPGMYAAKTIDRALYVLGLPNHGKANKLINAGEISLFIRKCDVNNIVFNRIYSNEWGWYDDVPPCENASANYENSSKPISTVNLKYYKVSATEQKKELAKQAKIIEEEVSSLRLEGYEKEAVVKARVNQSVFRKLLMKRYGRCCLCGIQASEMLIAGHIKPWVNSLPEEKLDPDNGFLLCPNHDRLFDSGLISFEDTGHIIISKHLTEVDRIFSNVRPDMVIKVTERNKQYLQYHRNNIFRA